MRKISLLVMAVTATMFFVSCKKDAKCPYTDSSVVAPQSEIDSIGRYLAANNITAVKHQSGLYYTLDAAGTGATPEVCSNLTVQYHGFVFNSNTEFDGTTGAAVANFTLGQTIEGWKKGIPMAKAGGKITLYIPPTLGYGNRDVTNGGVVVIPKNSYLKFDVYLISVQ